ncbi:hypothetical protein OH76DRAFT_1404366 [Lentinus brumalis]|uniref:Uncharacterized protein n=1 Tax=Lentinus brumalis TaxID=2498619 RepID=A0A371D8E8_9APHY|nr:hypothetical protein OH76DRAFT_1404366 [Polyporus brumalis]
MKPARGKSEKPTRYREIKSSLRGGTARYMLSLSVVCWNPTRARGGRSDSPPKHWVWMGGYAFVREADEARNK